MAEQIRIGVAGAGWPGLAHAKGMSEAGGFKIAAVADLIPSRRKKVMADFGAAREYADASGLIADRELDAISICLPNHLHLPLTLAALKAGKHVICETPPTLNGKEASQLTKAVEKSGKTLLFAAQRRFGGAELASKQAIAKGYVGKIHHVRASWLRTRGVPIGTGWYNDRAKSGGGALIDLGLQILDLAWHLIGEPAPQTVFAATRNPQSTSDKPGEAAKKGSLPILAVESAAFALVRFADGVTLELGASWNLNQPPQQQGTICRLLGESGAVDVYTPHGATIHRGFDAKGPPKATPLKPPKVPQYPAMMRHFKDCIRGTSQPSLGAAHAVTLMRMIDALYKSAETGKSVEIRA